MHTPTIFTLPRLGTVARRSVPQVIEATVVPVALMYAGLEISGLTLAVTAALLWAYAGIGARLVRGRPVPGLIMISAIMLTARSILAVGTGSAFLYFLQPALGTVLVALAFLASAMIRRPLAERLARDLVPLPDSLLQASWMRTFFVRITLLWAAVFAANAALSLWLLLTRSASTFVLGRSALSTLLTAAAIGVSTLVFVRMARRNDTLVVRG